jgi:diaminohydroxyphosphoribosylaminopyrimidine deaminase/5-amino-6-(5-phosphoribosylamino)uracil reductase
LKAGLVDELVLYFAPQLLGDMARGMAQLDELTDLNQRVELLWQDVRHVGKDLRILAHVLNPLARLRERARVRVKNV